MALDPSTIPPTFGGLKDQRIISIYVQIMEEVKARLNSINVAVERLKDLPNVVTYEYSILQIRLICELVALSCLTTHGDIIGKTLEQDWAADRIMNKLADLHPDFFPRPVTFVHVPVDNPAPGTPTHGLRLDTREGNFLTRRQLVDLYRKCGDRLHRGRMKRLLQDMAGTPIADPVDVADSMNRIIGLLDQHHIACKGNMEHLICTMRGGPNGAVQVSFARAPRET